MKLARKGEISTFLRESESPLAVIGMCVNLENKEKELDRAKGCKTVE